MFTQPFVCISQLLEHSSIICQVLGLISWRLDTKKFLGFLSMLNTMKNIHKESAENNDVEHDVVMMADFDTPPLHIKR